MQRMSLILGLALALSAGCTSITAKETPIVPDMAHGDYGSYPTDYEALIKTWAEMNLKDPESARYVHTSKPRKEWAVANLQPTYGWSVCSVINSKNSYGGYTGAQTFWFFIQNGKIVRSQNTDERIMGVIPGTRISIGHDVNCDDGDAPTAG